MWPPLSKSCRRPCQAVACCVGCKAGLLAKQQKENDEQLKLKEEKKRQALISSLQQQKIKLQEMRAETTEIDKHNAELESSKWTWNNF